MVLAILLPVLRVCLAPLPRTFQADLPINRVRGDFLPVIITAALALACYLAASKLVRMIRGGLKDFMTITTMVIFHQAAREGNRTEVSLEAPLNATRATSTAESAVYQMAATGCSFLATGHNNVRPFLDACRFENESEKRHDYAHIDPLQHRLIFYPGLRICCDHAIRDHIRIRSALHPLWTAVHKGCVFTQTTWDEEGFALRDPDSTTYTGAIETAEEFGKRIYREALTRGWNRAKKKVVIGDGAEWIWNLVAEHFPEAIQIVDLFHARQHLWAVARQLYPQDEVQQKAWMKVHQKRLLDKGKIEKLVGALRAIYTGNPALDEKIRTEADYFARNAERMRLSQISPPTLVCWLGCH